MTVMTVHPISYSSPMRHYFNTMRFAEESDLQELLSMPRKCRPRMWDFKIYVEQGESEEF
jgi:hypothetical protein